MFLLTRVTELVPHIIIVSGYFISALLIGNTLQQSLTLKEPQPFKIVTSLSLGFLGLSYWYFLIGIIGLYTWFFIYIPPATIAILGILRCIKSENLLRLSLNTALKTFHNKNLIIIASFLLIVSLFTIFPDIGFDSNWFHLSQPQYYLREGRLYHIGGYIFPSGYPQFMEMLYIPLLLVGNSLTTSLFSYTFYILLGIATYMLAKQFRLTDKFAILATMSVLTAPTILAYVDNAQAFFLTCSFIWLQKYVETSNPKDIAIAALSLIPVVTSKYSGGLWGIPLATYLIFVNRHDTKKHLVALCLLTLLPLLGLLPWLMRNYIQTGAPFDPIGRIALTMYNTKVENLASYIHLSLGSLWKAPLELKSTNLEILFPLITLISFVFYLVQKRLDIVLFLISSLFVWKLMPPGNDYRYFVPFLPILSVVSFKALHKFLGRRNVTILGITFLILLQLFPSLKGFRQFTPYALGMRDLHQFKNEFFMTLKEK
jgi:hypothetical protein